MKIKLVLTGFFLLATAIVVNAQNKTTDPVKENGKQTTGFVDKNNDGVCDNYESGAKKGPGYGNGNCNGQGKQFKYRNGQCKTAQKGKMQGNKAGRGPNFIDADKNGVCDTFENRNK